MDSVRRTYRHRRRSDGDGCRAARLGSADRGRRNWHAVYEKARPHPL